MALVDVLIPTVGRQTGLAVTLTSLLGQTFTDFDVVVSSQSESDVDCLDSIEIQTLVRALRWHDHAVSLHHHLPRRGMAEQRHFLLSGSRARYVHFLDDDVLLDPPVMSRMVGVLQQEGCGFVGCPATGLGFLDDARPDEERPFEPWTGPVGPEPFAPDTLPWERHTVNNAANPLHLEQRHCRHGEVLRYKVAWVGGANVLYDRAKLLDVGGFSWWERLPPEHAGEEVVVQFLLIRKYGGCGILPSGTYHLGLPTAVEDRRRNATELFADLIREFDERSAGAAPTVPPAMEVAGIHMTTQEGEEQEMSEHGLDGRVALITGAGSGLGAATARAFAAEGCALACLDRDRTAAERVSRDLAGRNADAVAIGCDVADAGEVERAVDEVVRRFGRLDVVVNCAAIDHTVSVDEMTIAQWDDVIRVNLRGPFLTAKAAWPVMRRQGGGHIVNVASTAATRAWANAAAYHASKWGLVGFSRGLGVEGRPDGIRVTTIISGGMRTHFFDRFVEQGIPMPDERNLQDPANVAAVVVFAVKMPAESALQEVIVTPLTETSWP